MHVWIILSVGLVSFGSAQNLVINGDFEDVISKVSHHHGLLDSFYAQHWFTPTGSTVDIYSSTENCSTNSVWNLEPKLRYCISVQSGNYCVGLIPMSEQGSLEHITGSLREPMRKNYIYKIIYNIKINGGETYYSQGFGFKMSKDSIVFKSGIQDFMGLSPFYNDLFETHSVFADGEIDSIPASSGWTKVEYIYNAHGGERFITFGKFAYREDKKMRKLFDRAMSRVNILNGKKLSKHYERLGFKKVNLPLVGGDADYQPNYYYLDGVKIILLDSISKEDSLQDTKNSEFNTPPNAILIDSDPNTEIPDQGSFVIDPGFFGKIKIEIGAGLQPMEELVIEYGKNRCVGIINTDQVNHRVSEYIYTLEYLARKLRKGTVKYYIRNVSQSELNNLGNRNDKEVIDTEDFRGIIIKRE